MSDTMKPSRSSGFEERLRDDIATRQKNCSPFLSGKVKDYVEDCVKLRDLPYCNERQQIWARVMANSLFYYSDGSRKAFEARFARHPATTDAGEQSHPDPVAPASSSPVAGQENCVDHDETGKIAGGSAAPENEETKNTSRVPSAPEMPVPGVALDRPSHQTAAQPPKSRALASTTPDAVISKADERKPLSEDVGDARTLDKGEKPKNRQRLRPPKWRDYGRVQSCIQFDPNLSPYLGKPIIEVEREGGRKYYLSPQVIEVANAFRSQGEHAADVTMAEIRAMAKRLLTPKGIHSEGGEPDSAPAHPLPSPEVAEGEARATIMNSDEVQSEAQAVDRASPLAVRVGTLPVASVATAMPDATPVPGEDDHNRQSSKPGELANAILDESLDDGVHYDGVKTEVLRTGFDAPEHTPGASESKTPAAKDDTKSAAYWLEKIKPVLVKSVNNLMEIGEILTEAKASLDHGEWLKLFKQGQLPFGERQAQYLMQVVGHRVLSNPNNRSVLPHSRTALVELAKADDTKVEQLIQSRRIHPALTAKEARLLVCADDGADAGHVERRTVDPAKTCERRLKVVGKFIEEAKSWNLEQRQRFCGEVRRLIESLAK